jgi:hypothetical protein
MRYPLKFFKNFESRNQFVIDASTINKLIIISKKVSDLPVKLSENTPISYNFKSPFKVKHDMKHETRVISEKEKTLIDIKSNLNKLTNDNIVEISKNISRLMTLETYEIIFEISYKNNFYSKTFSDMIIILGETNEEFKQFIHNKYEIIYRLFENVVYIPESNYDEFCNNIKVAEERKSFCRFFSYLCLNEFMEIEKISEFIEYLLNKIKIFINEENKKNEVDELLDIIYNIFSILKIPKNKFIEELSLSNNKSYKSLTGKSIYKCMDIMEL